MSEHNAAAAPETLIAAHEGRITGLEADMQHLTKTVDTLAVTVGKGFGDIADAEVRAERRHDERMAELHLRIDEQTQRLAERGRVSWPLVLSVIGTSFLLCGAGVSFVNMRITPVETALINLRTEARLEHAQIGEELLRQDERLQREMRDVSAVRSAEIAALDERLQREIVMLNAVQDVHTQYAAAGMERLRHDFDKLGTASDPITPVLKAMEKRIDTEVKRISTWQTLHDQNYPPAWLLNKVAAVEQKLDKLLCKPQ
jgi:hypothetical protein